MSTSLRVGRWLCIASALVWSFSPFLVAKDNPADGEGTSSNSTYQAIAEEIYTKQIRPVLQARCFACHGALKQEANLRVDSVGLMLSGGDSGSILTSSSSDQAILLKRITAKSDDLRMPPEGEPLKADQIAAIEKWLAAGNPQPKNDEPERDPKEHWAFQPPVRPAVPVVADPHWQRTPIDAFIAREHDTHGLKPQRPADRSLWLRRVTLDLTGLPPTVAEMDSFISDTSDDAAAKVVDRLLDSPQYGERWGRHWMDIWRYSDWWGLGAEVRNSQKHLWHWRDWIIDSLNRDKGYDQMLREMLAADELYPDDLDRLRATGFLARQYFKFNRTSWLDETIEHTSKAMLGLTMNCAKCHDHKYDPFTQSDYYSLRAVFEPYQVRTEMIPGEVDFQRNGIPRAFDCNLEQPTYVHIRGDDRNPDLKSVVPPHVPTLLRNDTFQITLISLPASAYQAGVRDYVRDAYLQSVNQKIAERQSQLDQARKQLIELRKTSATALADSLATKHSEGNAGASATVSQSTLPTLATDFTRGISEDWEALSGDWKYENNQLIQTGIGNTRGILRLKQPVTMDFEATLTYVPLGGQTWKSVGINFDVTNTGNELNAYLSSYADGPKAQVAYKTGGDYIYPSEAAQSRAVDLNKPHKLSMRVRGQLVNLIVDDEPSVSYRIPIARTTGQIQLITFDAHAEIRSFELSPLPPNVALREPSGQPAAAAQHKLSLAHLDVAIAERSLATAIAERDAIPLRHAADVARFSAPDSPETHRAIAAAAIAERTLEYTAALETLSRAELAMKNTSDDKRADAEKKLESAKASVEATEKKLNQPTAEYVSLRGADKAAESNLETEESRLKSFSSKSSGRRTALANWLTNSRNPLVARVAVNHIWTRHFGKPLVPTVFDFGRKGTAPSHPELLDWLAVELMENQWSMKHIHRLMVLSETYRMSSSNAHVPESNLTTDPENKYFWRMNPARMESEVIRDSILHLSNQLDLTMGGPSIPVSDEQSKRRSLYFVHSHNEHQKFLSMFDDASVLDCYRRAESIVPQQALALENSSLAQSMAGVIANQIEHAYPHLSSHEFVEKAWLKILAYQPNAEEIELGEQLLTRIAALRKTTNSDASESHIEVRTALIRALLNHNDFVTIR